MKFVTAWSVQQAHDALNLKNILFKVNISELAMPNQKYIIKKTKTTEYLYVCCGSILPWFKFVPPFFQAIAIIYYQSQNKGRKKSKPRNNKNSAYSHSYYIVFAIIFR